MTTINKKIHTYISDRMHSKHLNSISIPKLPSISKLIVIGFLLNALFFPTTEAIGSWPHNLSDTVGWLIYLGITSITFFVPLAFCLLITLSMVLIWLIRKLFFDEGRFLKKQIYLCFIPFGCVHFLLSVACLVFTFVYIVNTIYFLRVKDIGFSMGNHLITVPSSLNGSINSIIDSLQQGVIDGQSHRSELVSLDSSISSLYIALLNAVDFVDTKSGDLQSMVQSFNSLNENVANMTQFGYNFDTSIYNFGTSDNYTIMTDQSNSLKEASSSFTTLRSQIRNESDYTKQLWETYTTYLNTYYISAQSGTHTMLNSLGNFLDKYVRDLLTNYDLFSVLISLTLMICAVAILLVAPLICFINYYSIATMRAKWIQRLSFFSFILCIIFLFILPILSFILSFLTDACKQVDNFHLKAETIKEAVAFKDGFVPLGFDIDLSDTILKIERCTTLLSYIEAASLSNYENWKFNETTDSLFNNITAITSANITLFNVTNTTLSNYTNSFSTPTENLATLSQYLFANITSDYSTYMKNTYNYNLSDVLTATQIINSITSLVGYTFTYQNILDLNTTIAPFSTNLTSSQITTLEQYKPVIVAERDLILSNSTIQGLVDNFSYIYKNLTALQTYTSSVSTNLRLYVQAYETITSNIDNWIPSYNQIHNSNYDIPENTKANAITALQNSLDLSCSPIGDFFSNLDVMCTDFIITTSISTGMSFLVGVLYFLMFNILLCTHYRVEFLSELPYRMTTVRPFKRRVPFNSSLEELDDEHFQLNAP